MPLCRHCSTSFEHLPGDLEFYSDIGPVVEGVRLHVPPPTLCFQCRVQRKLAARNERHLYRRKCSLSGKDIFSIYSPDKSIPVYDNPLWYGDSWDALDFGRTFDPRKSFFSQFHELLKTTPRPARITFAESENSDYCNHHLGCKDSYLCFWGDYMNRSIACYGCGSIDQCVDCVGCLNSTLLVSARNCSQCHSSAFLEECEGVSESRYMKSCVNCTDCFQCTNLRHRQYCIKNQQYPGKEAYQNALKELLPSSYSAHLRLLREFKDLVAQSYTKAIEQHSCEGCTGHRLRNSKNCQWCFWSIGDDIVDSRYCAAFGDNCHRCFDLYGSGYGLTSCYDSFGLVSASDCAFSLYCGEGSHDLFYCADCTHSKNLFGCIGLRHKEFCIFNTQYTKAEYFPLVKEIVSSMRRDRSWGEFFPMALSPFGYNESAAHDHFPLTREKAATLGASWSEYEKEPPTPAGAIEAHNLPDAIEEVDDSILATPILCTQTKRPFRFTKLELSYYRMLKVPLPRLHPDVRLGGMAKSFGSFNLWEISCAECGERCPSGHPPEFRGKLLCNACFSKTLA